MARENATPPRWLNPTEMAAWRRYIVASRRLLEALDADLAAKSEEMVVLDEADAAELLANQP